MVTIDFSSGGRKGDKMRSENEMIDYDCNIQSHEQFVELLIKLRKLTKYITIVQIDRENKKEPLIINAQNKMELIDKYKAQEWYGTFSSEGYGMVYEFEVKDKSFFDDLLQYEAFYIPSEDQEGSYCPKRTDFGIDDIAFLDKDERPLFYTTTHEGFSMIHPDVLDVDISQMESFC